jgi:accessory colonization factor AcfC
LGKLLKSVDIEYNTSGVWEYINVRYADGDTVQVYRQQVEAFESLSKVLLDLKEVKRLRDELVSIFGDKEVM